jgi:urea carboxylase
VPLGRHKLEIEEKVFRFADYEAFLDENAGEIAAFRETQQAAFQEERRRWGKPGYRWMHLPRRSVRRKPSSFPKAAFTLDSPVTGSVWKIDAVVGARIATGGAVLILEAMKMEVALEADEAIEIIEILAIEGGSVKAGQALVIAKLISS